VFSHIFFGLFCFLEKPVIAMTTVSLHPFLLFLPEGYSLTDFDLNYWCECLCIFTMSISNIGCSTEKSNHNNPESVILRKFACEIGLHLAFENLNFRRFPFFPEWIRVAHCVQTIAKKVVMLNNFYPPGNQEF
jgi:hypothetical protein